MGFEQDTYAIANYLTFVIPDDGVFYRFQNFYLNENVPWVNGTHSFMPFGFSGITVDRQGGNVEAVLTFPNKKDEPLARDWAQTAVENFWLARVRVVLVDPDDPTVAASDPDRYRLYNYVGQVASATWDETTISLQLNSVLDAVQSNAPNRKLNRNLCGHLPTTNRISI